MGFHGEFYESVSDPKIGANQKEPLHTSIFHKNERCGDRFERSLVVSKTRRYPKNIDTEGDRMVTGL